MYGGEDPRDSAHGREVRSEAGKAVNLSGLFERFTALPASLLTSRPWALSRGSSPPYIVSATSATQIVLIVLTLRESAVRRVGLSHWAHRRYAPAGQLQTRQ